MGNGSFWFFFLLIGLIRIEALLPTAWCFQWGFSRRYMGGGWVDGKRTQWLGFLILRKIERTAEFVKGKGESKQKRLCVCNSGGRSMVRGLVKARSLLSFFCFFHRVFTLHHLSLFLFLSPCLHSLSLDLGFRVFVATQVRSMCLKEQRRICSLSEYEFWLGNTIWVFDFFFFGFFCSVNKRLLLFIRFCVFLFFIFYLFLMISGWLSESAHL